MSKHTRGPWRLGRDPYLIVAVEKNRIVAEVLPITPGRKANARLIAAAPEMHDFLRDILEARGIDEHGLATLKDFFDNLNGGKNGTP